MQRKISKWLGIAAVAVLATPGCGPSADDAPPESTATTAVAPAIAVFTVTGRPYVEKVELPGASIHGFETTRIMSKVSGYVESIGIINGEEVDIGTVVKAGDVLAVLEVPEMQDELNEKQALVQQARSAVDQAEANIHQAEANLVRRRTSVDEAVAHLDEKKAMIEFRQTEHQRYVDLVSNDAARPDLLDEATFQLAAAKAALKTGQAAIETAKSEVAAAEANVAKSVADKRGAEANVHVAQAALGRMKTLSQYATIRAPLDGVVTRRMVDHGAFVRPANNSEAQPLFEITRNDKVRVIASVPVAKAARVKLNQNAVCHSIGGLPSVRVAGKVTRSTVVLDNDSRMLRIDIDCTNPVDVIGTDRHVNLQPGMFCTVTVTLRKWDALPVVPTSAVASDEHGDPYVMVVEEGRCRRRNVTIAFDDAIEVGISRGIEVGAVLIQHDVDKVADGQAISVSAG